MKWIKRKKRALPEDKICRNCGVETQGRYCHECGQDVFAGAGQPIVNLAGQVLENAFALDAKAPRTLFYLLFRPGFLSEEYRNGKINKYVHPVKLFWMVSLILFALLVSQNSSESKVESRKHKNLVEINLGNSVSDTTDTDASQIAENDFEERLMAITDENKKRIDELFIKYLPYVSFLLIPVFALLLMLFFRRAKYYYVYHLMFAVHFHTFLYLLLTLINIPDLFVTHTISYPDWCNFLFFIIPGIYFTIALRKFYQTKRWRRTLWKAIAISFFYLILIGVIIMGFALLIAYSQNAI